MSHGHCRPETALATAVAIINKRFTITLDERIIEGKIVEMTSEVILEVNDTSITQSKDFHTGYDDTSTDYVSFKGFGVSFTIEDESLTSNDIYKIVTAYMEDDDISLLEFSNMRPLLTDKQDNTDYDSYIDEANRMNDDSPLHTIYMECYAPVWRRDYILNME